MKNFPVNKISCRQKAARRLSAQNIKNGQPLFLKKRLTVFSFYALTGGILRKYHVKNTMWETRNILRELCYGGKKKTLMKSSKAKNPASEILFNERITDTYKKNRSYKANGKTAQTEKTCLQDDYYDVQLKRERQRKRVELI